MMFSNVLEILLLSTGIQTPMLALVQASTVEALETADAFKTPRSK